jgi:hypothetical protein
MKKLYSLIALLTAVILFTACGKDDATYNPAPKLEVTAVNVLFEPEGGQGSITVNTASSLSATTDASWLSLTVNGNQVTAVADANTTLDGRSAKITLQAGGAEAFVTATQKGSVYGITLTDELLQIADTANSQTAIPIVHSGAVNVESLVDWLSARFDEESSSIVVVGQANPQKEARTGYVAYATGNIKDTLTITQKGNFDFAKGVLGDYMFVYRYIDEEAQDFAWNYFDATLTADGLTILYPVSETDVLPFTVPVKIDADKQEVKFGPNGSFLGMYGTSYYIFLQFGAYAEGYPVAPYTDNSTTITGTLSFEKEQQEDGTIVESTYMDFAGQMDGTDINMWYFEAFDSENFVAASDKGSFNYFITPYMIKIPAAEPTEQPVASEARKQLVAKKLAAMKGKLRKQTGLNVLRTPWKK